MSASVIGSGAEPRPAAVFGAESRPSTVVGSGAQERPSTFCFRGDGGAAQFREQISEQLWDVDADWTDGASPELSMQLVALGTRALVQRLENTSGCLRIVRARERLTRANHLAFGVSVVRRGACRLVVEGRVIELRAGEVSIVNGANQFTKAMSEDYAEDLILARNEAPLCATARAVDRERASYMREPALVVPLRGAAALLADHVQSLFTHQHDLAGGASGGLTCALLGLIEASFSVRTEPRPDTVREAQRQKIERFVSDHLHDPALTPARAASAHRMSLRYLHGLFENADRSFCSTLRELRLQAARRALARPERRALSVGEVAHTHGFVSTAHFCRTFKARFGMSPSETRDQARLLTPR